MRVAEYVRLTATEMAALVRSDEVSPVELTRAALDAIDEVEQSLNAYAVRSPELALSMAQTLEAEARRGEFRSPLHGVPYALKDLSAAKGLRTASGSKLYADRISMENSPACEKMIAAGAIMVGKTTTPEFGWKGSSNSPLYGVTRNPWNVTKTAGGSSSGAGAAVAARTVPIALGSDGGGSMRIPASFCGIFSLKPTLGLVGVHPASPTEQLSHSGPMTNSVADYALALDALTGVEPRDPLSFRPPEQSFAAAIQETAIGLRCAFAPTLFGHDVDPEVAAAVAGAVDMLGKAGLSITPVAPDWASPLPIFETMWSSRGLSMADKVAEHPELFDPGFVRMAHAGSRLTLADYVEALAARASFYAEVSGLLQQFDLLILPTMPILPFAAEADGPSDMDTDRPVPWATWTPFTYPFNLTGQPAASIPCGWSQGGLPIGLQVVGRKHEDASVLKLCALWERLAPWRDRSPAVAAGQR